MDSATSSSVDKEKVSASEFAIFASGVLRNFEILSLRLFSQQNPGETPLAYGLTQTFTDCD